MFFQDSSPEATPVSGEDSSQQREANQKLTDQISERMTSAILDAKTDTWAAEQLTSMYKQLDKMDRAAIISIHRDLVRVYTTGEGFKHTTYNAKSLDDPDTGPFGALTIDQLSVLLHYLRLLVPFNVDADGTLVSRIPQLLLHESAELSGYVKPLVRTLAKESSVFCTRLVEMVYSLPQGSPLLETIYEIMIDAVTHKPTMLYDALATLVQKGTTMSAILNLLSQLIKRKAILKHMSEHRLYAVVVEYLQKEPMLLEVIQAVFTTCLLLPTFRSNKNYRINDLFDVFLRILRWPRKNDGTAQPLEEIGTATSSEDSSQRDFFRREGALDQCLWAMMQSLYWSFPSQTVACISAITIEADRNRIYTWFFDMPLHAHVTHGDSSPMANIPPLSDVFGNFAPMHHTARDHLHNNSHNAGVEASERVDILGSLLPSDASLEDTLKSRKVMREREILAKEGRKAFEKELQDLRQDIAALSDTTRTEALRDPLQTTVGNGTQQKEILALRAQLLFSDYLRSQQLNHTKSLNRELRDVKIQLADSHARFDTFKTQQNALSVVEVTSRSVVDTDGWKEDRIELMKKLDELSIENEKLSEQNRKLEAQVEPSRAEIEKLKADLYKSAAEIAMLHSKEAKLQDGATERGSLDKKVGALTDTLMQSEKLLADDSEFADLLSRTSFNIENLLSEHTAVKAQVTSLKAKLVDRDVRLTALAAEKLALGTRCKEAAVAADQLREVLNKANLESAAKLRAVQHKYASVKQINVLLEDRIAELFSELEHHRESCTKSNNDSPQHDHVHHHHHHAEESAA